MEIRPCDVTNEAEACKSGSAINLDYVSDLKHEYHEETIFTLYESSVYV